MQEMINPHAGSKIISQAVPIMRDHVGETCAWTWPEHALDGWPTAQVLFAQGVPKTTPPVQEMVSRCLLFHRCAPHVSVSAGSQASLESWTRDT